MSAADIAARLNARLGLKPEPPAERTVVSQRYTTSSRTPGVVNDRSVRVRGSRVIVCADCGGLMLDCVHPGAHGARYAGGQLVNCVGRPL